MIKLYTSKNCQHCEQVKAALEAEGLEYEALDTEMFWKELEADCHERGVTVREIREAPAMVAEGCDMLWTGLDCLVAIEEREWE